LSIRSWKVFQEGYSRLDEAPVSSLDSLSNAIKNAIGKLIGVPVVDRKAIEELVKDLQRALLVADVNAEIVLKISEKIRDRSLKTKTPPGISKKDQVVKIVYEELVGLLGEKQEKLRIAKKPYLIMVVGIQGSGKCVAGDTTIPLANGTVLSARDLYQGVLAARSEQKTDDGYFIDTKGLDLKVYSVDMETLKIKEREVSRLWRLNSPPLLVEVNVDLGKSRSIVTTLEHPFYSLSRNEIAQIPAAHLKRGTYIMVPPALPSPAAPRSIGALSKPASRREGGQAPGSSQRELATSYCARQQTIPTWENDAAQDSAAPESQILLTAPALIDPGSKKSLEAMTLSDVFWARVARVQIIAPTEPFVYDLTVPKDHNFLTEAAVVHNTTTVAKLANYLQKEGHRPGVVCTDTFRPAAYAQLQQLLAGTDTAVYGETDSGDAVRIARNGLKSMHEQGRDVIVFDTAGRHKDQESLMKEMKQLEREIRPDEVMLVLDGGIGQQAGPQAAAFHKATPLGSIIVTKLDTSARGGGAISAVSSTGARIRFLGVGERIDDLETFVPSGFVGRLLGMGDLDGLLEKVRLAEMELSKETAQSIVTGEFTLEDMVSQFKEMRKLGPLRKIVSKLPIPGLPNIPPDQMDKAEEELSKWLVIVQSMTPDEKKKPRIIDSSRARRIARGSGVMERDVKNLVKQYNMARRLMKAWRRRPGVLPKRVRG